MSPSTNPWAGRGGHQKAHDLNIFRPQEKSNALESPLLFYERFLLCRLMVSGSLAKYKHFADSRNKLICSYLSYLQKQKYLPDVNSLVGYMDECGVMEQAGGEQYIRGIFRGIPEGVLP
jgi:hypothetical protein